jgi:predicted metalloprotease with PDZ domain
MGIPEVIVAAPSQLSRQHFTVRMPDPANHLLEVELQIQEVDPEVPLRLRLPVWTPGSYLVREYARHVQEFQAATEQGIPLAWRKVDKNTWQIDPPGCSAVKVCYRVYAYELTVRTNHLDLTPRLFQRGSAVSLRARSRAGTLHLDGDPPQARLAHRHQFAAFDLLFWGSRFRPVFCGRGL